MTPTLRSVVLGLLLIPVLVAWAQYVEIKAAGPDMISTSILLCVMFALIIVLGLNALVRRAFPRLALTGRELLVVYVMGSVGISPTGIGMLQWLIPGIVAKDSGGKSPLLHITDPRAITAFREGRTAWADYLGAWIGPILTWSGFLLVLFGVMFCLSVLLRKQWVERERLLFPLVQLPLELFGEIGGAGAVRLQLGRNRLFWLGVAAPVVLQGLAALHYTYFPTLPFFPLKPSDLPDLQSIATAAGKPWSGVGYLRLAFYPFVIGLAFLLSLEISFSCWASYGLIKLVGIVTFALGLNEGVGADLWNTKAPPRFGDQGFGGFLGLALLSLYLARGHLKETLKRALGEPCQIEDGDEALSYRTAWAGLALGGALLVGFAVWVGLPLVLALSFFTLFLLVVIGFSRIRAEAGVPWGYGPPMNVNGFLIEAVGTAHWNREALTSFSSLLWMDSDYRSTQMPYQAEALKIGSTASLAARRLTLALLLSLIVGLAAGWISQLSLYYHFGAENGLQRGSVGEKFGRLLSSWISTTKPTDWGRLGEVGVGMAVVWVLGGLRNVFSGWPLHPVGYVVSCTWTMQWLWCPMLLGWLLKALVLRYGGMRGYRGALPFFLGLVLGDYAISGGLALFYTLVDAPGYRTFPI